MNILLIEDDIQLNTTITSFLQFKEFHVTSLFDGSDALELIDDNEYDLYIVDINLPNLNGLEIIKYIRNKVLSTPVIMITASLELDNLKIAYKYGCDEYIKKPFHLDELEIRINKLLLKETQKTINIAPNISYDMEYEELQVDGAICKLRKKERRLLTILLEHMNHTVNYEYLENYIWENEIKTNYPLRQLVATLKKQFGKYGNIIETDRGKGYRIMEEKS